MELYRIRWALKDAWQSVKRGMVIGFAFAFGVAIGWAACATYIAALDRNVTVQMGAFE